MLIKCLLYISMLSFSTLLYHTTQSVLPSSHSTSVLLNFFDDLKPFSFFYKIRCKLALKIL